MKERRRAIAAFLYGLIFVALRLALAEIAFEVADFASVLVDNPLVVREDAVVASACLLLVNEVATVICARSLLCFIGFRRAHSIVRFALPRVQVT